MKLLFLHNRVSPPFKGGKRGVCIALLLTLMMLSTPAFAQVSDFERDVLRSIDTVPSRAQLDANYPQARAQLEATALDSKHEMWIRHRAITLLSHYPDARTRSFLEQLLKHDDHHIRRMAVYTLGRTFGKLADTDLVAKLADVIKGDENEEVAQWAVRSLRWVHHDDATTLLTTLSKQDDVKGRVAALALKRSEFSATTAR